jgi:hypothetical protein
MSPHQRVEVVMPAIEFGTYLSGLFARHSDVAYVA